MPDMSRILDLARDHGDESGDVDYEVGDLQAALRIVWNMLTDDQRKTAFHEIITNVFAGEGVFTENHEDDEDEEDL